MNIREVVMKVLGSVVEQYSPVPFPEEVDDDTMLDEFWLDSVAFAALISGMEEALGFVPDAILEGAFYPETFGEFVTLYEDAKKERA